MPIANPHQQAEARELPPQFREAQLVPSTFNEEDMTVELVWTTGARRRAYDYWNETVYEEELVVDDQAVDMARFEAGVVQVLDGHRVYGGVQAILGIAVRGWIENGEGRALIKLSGRPEVAGIVSDIKAGIIRSVSFGYSVQRYEITRAQDRTDGVNLPLYRAVLWTPQELSFVTVPADPGASTRAQQQLQSQPPQQDPSRQQAVNGVLCEFVRAVAPTTTPQEMTMPNAAELSPGAAPATPAQQPALQQHARAAEPTPAPNTAADIIELCTRHNVPNMAADMVRSGVTLDQARQRILDELAVRDAQNGGHRNVRVETVRDEIQTRMDGIAEAMMTRVDGRAQLTDNGRQFRGMTLLEMGRDLLEAHNVNTRGMDRMALATRILTFRSGGMHGTGDFASLLANVASKRLRAGYQENPGTYSRWARRAPNAPDFKAISVVQMSAMPDLLRVNEHGEFKYGTVSDGAESYSVITYGRIVSLSRAAMINDDLRAFDRLVTGFGDSAARLENRLVYSQLTANANMADGTALFHTSRGNNATGGGSALQFSSLSAARAAMRKQKGLQNEELNLVPAFLIAPADLEQTAYQLTSSNYTPATKAEVNEFRAGGRTALEPIIEPILDAASSTTWYLAARNGQVDTVEYCWLDGAEGPVIESEVGFEVDGVSFKCREDFAAKAIDYRGLYRGVGA